MVVGFISFTPNQSAVGTDRVHPLSVAAKGDLDAPGVIELLHFLKMLSG
jgi:hypothetical protein